MKLALRILLSLVTIWSIFDEELNKPFALLRHLVAFLVTYPTKVFLLLCLTISCIFFIYRFYFQEQDIIFKSNFSRIEPLLESGEVNNANVKTFSGTIGYYKIIKETNKPIRTDSSFEFTIKQFLEKGRFLYSQLPSEFRSKPQFKSSFFEFPTPCQFMYVDNKFWKRKLLCFSKTDGNTDKFSVVNYEFDKQLKLEDLKT